MHSVYISVAVLHTLHLHQFSIIISVQTFQHLKVTAQQTFKKKNHKTAECCITYGDSKNSKTS